MKALKLTNKYLYGALLGAMAMLTASCESIFDEEGDCTPKYAIRFAYTENLKWADAFASEVKSVNLYVFDDEGRYIKQYSGRGAELAQPGYEIMLDLPLNRTYTFVAWCGMDNEGVTDHSFSVTDPVVGATSLEDFLCTMATSPTPPITRAGADGDEGAPLRYSYSQLQFLYHGLIANKYLEDTEDGKLHPDTIYLTKDTNHIRVQLQELDGDGVENPEDFTISIEDDNGVYAYNNDLVGHDPILYLPWDQQVDYLGVGGTADDEGVVNQIPGLVADLSLGRLMADKSSKTMLKVTNKEGKVVVNVPILQYFLNSLSYYEQAYGRKMTKQQLLDRQDEYVITFFLQGARWVSCDINILEWRVVYQNHELNN